MTMLTDTQLIVLSKAAAREDAVAIVPPKITRAGRDAISIDEPDVTYQPVSRKSSDSQRADRHQAGAAPRPGSKQALVVEMLSKQVPSLA